MRVNLGVKKAARCAWAALVFLQVCLSFRHYPDQSNHKRSLLRKKEDNNQDKDVVNGL